MASVWEFPTMNGVWYALGGLYLAIEVAFYFLFHYYLVPRANEWQPPAPYRDYGRHRHELLFRIIDRASRHAVARSEDVSTAIAAYIRGCFDPLVDGERVLTSPVPRTRLRAAQLEKHAAFGKQYTASTVASTVSDTDSVSGNAGDDVSSSSTCSGKRFTVDGIGRSDMEDLFTWCFFGKHSDMMEDWENEELEKMFDLMEERIGLYFEEGSPKLYQARKLSLEDTDPLHRPLLVYLYISLVKIITGIVLRCAGFQRTTCSKGLVGWYRPAKAGKDKLLPLLFFHGLAPGGIFFYIPMLLWGLLTDGRAAFLFENPNITCKIGFEARNEEDTVAGMEEIVCKHLGKDQKVALCGHSFGSVPMTWLLHAKQFRHRVQQYCLLDPVTLLISEPDVMVNFLYRKEVSLIRLVAGSELFTEYYLRRHFFFYNSELWLEDLKDIEPIIVLAEKDEIVNARNVQAHVELANKSIPLRLHFWEGVSHGYCVTSPEKWREIKGAMLQQELQLARSM